MVLMLLTTASLMAGEQLDEANAKFTYNGKPIHPFLIYEFSNWMSDSRPPMITTVDVAAAFDSNKYQQSTIEKREDWLFSTKEKNVHEDYKEVDMFGYHWLGTLANGIHVVEIGYGGGGSGFFMDLIFIKFFEGEITWENKKEKQLLMSIVGIHSLGDRYEGDIKVFPNKVFIPASESQRWGGAVENDIELNFPVE
jgi:hypothetical protein